MNKLTLSELSAYLPHDLEVLIQGTHTSSIANLTKNGFDSNFLHALSQGWVKILDLRPLSQLTEEIEHNSISIQLEPSLEKVKPSELIYKHWFYTIREDGHFSYHIGDGTAIGALYGGVTYSLIELLIEWHFDVFGLIDRGLALPIDGKEVK